MDEIINHHFNTYSIKFILYPVVVMCHIRHCV